MIRSAVFIASGEHITSADLMLEEDSGMVHAYGRIKDMEKEMIFQTLREVNDNKTSAARLLGVSVRTIRNKLNGYG